MKDKVVLITGISSGIGQAIALKYLEEGYSVCGLDVRPSWTSNSIDAYVCNVSDEKDVRRTFEVIQKKYSSINYLINCAGIFFDQKRLLIEDMIIAEWNSVLMNNLNGCVLVTQRAIPLLKNAVGDKAIVYISSDQAIYPRKNNSAYAVSKAGITNLSRACAVELLEAHIRVNCVMPASVRSNFIKKLAETEDAMDRIFEKVNDAMPFGIIEPSDVAETVYFFGSEKSQKITGQSILLNSGLYI